MTAPGVDFGAGTVNHSVPDVRLLPPGRWTIPLSARLTAVMVALIAATLLLTTCLNYAKFQRKLEGFADQRFTFVLNELGQAIEAGVSVGLSLSELHNIQDLLDRQQQRDPTILSIDVADDHGALLYSSVPGRTGDGLPRGRDRLAGGHDAMRSVAPGVVTLAQPLLNAFNDTLGTVVLRYATARYEATERAVLHRLLLQAGAAAALFSVVALLGFRWLLQGFRGSVRRMSASLEATLQGMPGDTYQARNAIERQFAGLLQLVGGGPAPVLPSDDGDGMGESAAYGRRVVLQMFALTAIVLVLPLGLVGFSATRAFEAALVPQMHQKAAALAHAIAADLDHATRIGIPLDQLVGAAAYLQDYLPLVAEARYIGVETAGGEMLYAAGRDPAVLARSLAQAEPELPPPAQPGADSAAPDWRIVTTPEVSDLAIATADGAARVHIGISRDILAQQVRDIAADVVVLSAAGLLMTFELLLLAVACAVSHPLTLLAQLIGAVGRGDLAVRVGAGGRSDMARLLRLIDMGLDRLRGAPDQPRPMHAADLTFIRTPLFLFCFAEEFVRSFFPLYANGLAANLHGLSSELLAGLPITLFMLVVALCTPLASVYSDRVGRRPAFLYGTLISTTGLLLSAVAVGYWDMLLYRAISGIGYAVVFMAVQGYMIDNTSPRNRAQGISIYVGAIAAADLASPPIGGILADQIGFRLAFVVAGGVALAALLLAWRLVRDDPAGRARRPALRGANILRLAQNWRLLSMVLCVSMPAKILLTGFLFYLVPLHLAALGQTPATVGRVLMVYALGSLVVTPLAARLVDRAGGYQAAVIGGSAAAAASLLLTWADAGLLQVALAVAGFGIGQAVGINTQGPLMMRFAAADAERMGTATVLSIVRLFERLAAALGPLAAAGLLAAYGARVAMTVLGLGSLAMLVLFGTLLLLRGQHSRSMA